MCSRPGLSFDGPIRSHALKNRSSSSSVNMCGNRLAGLAIQADGITNASAPTD